MNIPGSSLDRTAKAFMAQKVATMPADELSEMAKKVGKTPENIKAEMESLSTKRWELNMRKLFGILFGVSVILAIVRLFIGGESWNWLIVIPPLPETVGELAIVLGPLVAVSVAVERLLETIFDWFEQSKRALADLWQTPKELLDWVGREYRKAYEATEAAAKTLGIGVQAADLIALENAEKRLATAEERLQSWTKGPEYKAWKRALSIWAGLLVGLIVAIFGDVGMLHLIGFPVPRLLDMLVTGLVIGAGPGPMHSLIGILQGSKDAVNNLAELAKGKSIKEAAEAVRSASAQTTP